MTVFKKNQTASASQLPKIITNGFRVEAIRLTNDKETYLKIQGAFKTRIQNKGKVGVKIFGAFDLPGYSDETFEPGDSILGFVENTNVMFDPHTASDKIEIIVTNYYKV